MRRRLAAFAAGAGLLGAHTALVWSEGGAVVLAVAAVVLFGGVWAVCYGMPR